MRRTMIEKGHWRYVAQDGTKMRYVIRRQNSKPTCLWVFYKTPKGGGDEWIFGGKFKTRIEAERLILGRHQGDAFDAPATSVESKRKRKDVMHRRYMEQKEKSQERNRRANANADRRLSDARVIRELKAQVAELSEGAE